VFTIKLIKNLEKIADLLNKIITNITVIAVAIMSIIVFVQVVLRYIFGTGLGWVEEVSILLMMWIAFVGGSLLFYDKSNISITILIDKIQGTPKKIMSISFCILTFIFSYILCRYGMDYARIGLVFRFGGINISRFWSFVSVPIGAVFIFYFTMVDLIKLFYNEGEEN